MLAGVFPQILLRPFQMVNDEYRTSLLLVLISQPSLDRVIKAFPICSFERNALFGHSFACPLPTMLVFIVS